MTLMLCGSDKQILGSCTSASLGAPRSEEDLVSKHKVEASKKILGNNLWLPRVHTHVQHMYTYAYTTHIPHIQTKIDWLILLIDSIVFCFLLLFSFVVYYMES